MLWLVFFLLTKILTKGPNINIYGVILFPIYAKSGNGRLTMQEFSWLFKMVEQIGFPALIFAIWYFYHKSSVAQFNEIISQQNEASKAHFELLKDMIQTNILQTSLLQDIQAKITNNQWCPFVQGFLKGKDFKDVADNADKN